MPNHMHEYHLINQQTMIQLKTKKDHLFVFQLYAPDSSHSDEEKKEFQELNILPRKSKLIVMSDFN